MSAPRRIEDLSDVLALIRAAGLPLELASGLDPLVQSKYKELRRAARTRDED